LAEPGALKVDYTPTPGQAWRWYGRFWLQRLWYLDLGLAFLVLTVVMYLTGNVLTIPLGWTGLAAALALLLLTLSPALSMSFAAHGSRSLEIRPEGLATGERQIAWSDIVAIDDFEGGLAFRGRSRTAVIVPLTAFASPADREAFAAQARAWKATAKP
jgi:hypothetical protein